MKKAIVVFKGWGSTDSFYRDFLDKLDAEIIFSEDLYKRDLDNFQEIIAFGWSMGTLDCIRFIRDNKIEKSILIAPTLDFTKTTRALIIKKMIKRLKVEKAGCLRDFIELNFSSSSKFEAYLEEYFEDILKISDEDLIKGLNKLIEDKIPRENSYLNPIIILGSKDKVIPEENSKDVTEYFPNAVVYHVNGGHNLIYEEKEKVFLYIKRYLKS
ncbi:alpha/beta hydrolase fold protein [Ilyobacter polytropus]|uniref:Alpha/beta hydrolase fold protein n=1 Tax=Ilyobacter polytropus (strain ATCC 51220 / DSM 2926 / LMG 16218 / CuHBu1) TaxID=572544 RepID=E3H7G5_ILYPC|nr:alpha/beta hydrolase fold protein [Ilyobacter polytropus]ADO82861.1 alpha/beta hydrolase fold protein [Ilyobacter polytropus DSM 2926]